MKVLVLGSGVIGVSAAYELARDGHEVEVIDLRSITPWDQDLVADSVARTGRALVVHARDNGERTHLLFEREPVTAFDLDGGDPARAHLVEARVQERGELVVEKRDPVV